MKRYKARWVLLRRKIGGKIKLLVEWMKTHSLPGLFGLPIYDVGVFLYDEVRKDDPIMRANAVAFNLFLSLFPAIITLFTLLPYFPVYANFNETLYNTVRDIMPGSAGDWLLSFLDDIATQERRGLLSFSTLLFLYFSTNGTASLMFSFEKKYPEIFKNRSTLMIRWIALWLTLLLATMVVVSVALVIAGNTIITYLGYYFYLDEFTKTGLDIFRWILVISMFYSSISLLYRYGAPTHRKIRFFSTGASVATVMAIASSILFSMYINAFGTYNELYGSIGTIIGLMLWLQINAFSIIAGYELNTAILFHRVTSKLRKEKELQDQIKESQLELEELQEESN